MIGIWIVDIKVRFVLLGVVIIGVVGIYGMMMGSLRIVVFDDMFK